MRVANICSYQSYISALASSIDARVLLAMNGTGNYGESGASAIYAIDKLPKVLELEAIQNKSIPQLKRVDIDLGEDRLAFYIDNVLTPEEADALAACAESVLETNGHSRLAPGINTPPGMRINEAASWYPSHSSNFMRSVFERFRHLVPQTLGGLPVHSRLSERMGQFKYTKGDRFNRHVDGIFPSSGANPKGDGIDVWTGVYSGMTVLFYLNDNEDGLEGGETRLWSADGSKAIDISPRKGRVLCFRRGSYDAVLHAGMEVSGDVPKYVAVVHLPYGEQIGTRPMLA